MPILRREPPRAAESLDDVFAIAHAMEHEAATRYAELALRMRKEGNATHSRSLRSACRRGEGPR